MNNFIDKNEVLNSIYQFHPSGKNGINDYSNYHYDKYTEALHDCVCAIEDTPSHYVDEDKSGEWIPDEEDPKETFNCSVCGSQFIMCSDDGIPFYKYCPNCGARMKEVFSVGDIIRHKSEPYAMFITRIWDIEGCKLVSGVCVDHKHAGEVLASKIIDEWEKIDFRFENLDGLIKVLEGRDIDHKKLR